MNITLTSHAKYRIEKRKLREEEVIDSIHRPDVILNKHGKYYYQKRLQNGNIEVVCEKTEKGLNVITVYWV